MAIATQPYKDEEYMSRTGNSKRTDEGGEMSAEQEILCEVKGGFIFRGISVVPKGEAQIYEVSKALGFDVFILFNVNPFGTVCFSNEKERYYYRIHNVKPVLLEGDRRRN